MRGVLAGEMVLLLHVIEHVLTAARPRPLKGPHDWHDRVRDGDGERQPRGEGRRRRTQRAGPHAACQADRIP